MADELPPPDVLDQSGRMRRLVLALIVGAAAAAAAYAVTNAMARPDEQHATYVVNNSPYRFVFYMTAFFGAGAFAITLAITNWRAKQKYLRERGVPPAKQIS